MYFRLNFVKRDCYTISTPVVKEGRTCAGQENCMLAGISL